MTHYCELPNDIGSFVNKDSEDVDERVINHPDNYQCISNIITHNNYEPYCESDSLFPPPDSTPPNSYPEKKLLEEKIWEKVRFSPSSYEKYITPQ